MKKKKRKIKRKSKTSKSKKIDALDRAFSLFVRAYWADDYGYVSCFTCSEYMKWKGGGAQCGHFISRKDTCVRWDRNNARPQCGKCNVGLSGNLEVYEEKLKAQIGTEKVEFLKKKAKDTCTLNIEEMDDILKNIKTEYKKILEQKNL